MKKWGLIGLGIAIFSLIAFFVYRQLGGEYTTQTIWRGWQGKAKNDGFYLAKELLKHHDNKITIINHFPTPTELSKNQVIIADSLQLTEEEDIEKLHAWIRAGGRLFISAGGSKMHKLGGGTEIITKPKEDGETFWEDTEQRFHLGEFSDCRRIIQLSEGIITTGVAKTPAGCELIRRFRLGEGQLILLTNWTVWQDGFYVHGLPADEEKISILQAERGAMLSYLVGDGNHILWLKKLIGKPKFTFPTRWLIPILVAVMSLLFFIWRVGSRFGVLLTFQHPQNANLQRHLQAAGDLLTAVGAEKTLLAASRERLRAELPTDYQIFLDDRARLTAALEKDFALAPSLVGEALYREDGKFIHKMRAIEKVRSIIGKIK